MLASNPSQHLESQIPPKGNPLRFTQTMNRSSFGFTTGIVRV